MKILFACLFFVQLMTTDSIAMKIESCNSAGECRIDYVPVLSDRVCNEEYKASSYALKWLKFMRPEFKLKYVECVRYQWQFL